VRLLVTGGAGFIGSEYVRNLVSDVYGAAGKAPVIVSDRPAGADHRAGLDPVADLGGLTRAATAEAAR
jgi:dTDP-glucose 4,6-dehydratase